MADSTNEAGSGNAPSTGKKKRSKKTSDSRAKTSARADSNAGDTAPVSSAAAAGPGSERVSPVHASSGAPGSNLGWTAVVISVLALGASGYAWYQTAVNARLAGGEQNNRLQIMEQQLDGVNSSQANIDGVVDQVRQRVADSETGIAEQVSQVKQLIGSTETALLAQISEVRQQVTGSETRVAGEMDALRGQIDGRNKAIEARMAEASQALEARNDGFRTDFDALATSIGELRAELGTSVAQWSLREVEHLLIIANQRARLGQDTENASAALHLADQRLEQLGEPTLLPVREALSREIAALGEIQSVDYAGVTHTLTLLSSTLEDLPMRGITTIAGPQAVKGSEGGSDSGQASSGENAIGIGRSLLADIGSLVQIEKDGDPVIPPLSPEIRQMIIERGKLILEGAQVALMRGQPVIFQDRLNAAEQWVRERFVEDDDQTGRWLDQLDGLRQVDPGVEIPDISGSLTALRNLTSGGA